MDKLTLARQLVAALGQTLTVALALDDVHHSGALVFDDSLILNLQFDEATGGLVLSCWLAELPPEGAEPLLRELLMANFHGRRTRGPTLALDSSRNGVLLVRSVSVSDTEPAQLESIVEDFVQQSEQWRKHVRERAHAQPDGAWAPTVPSHMDLA